MRSKTIKEIDWHKPKYTTTSRAPKNKAKRKTVKPAGLEELMEALYVDLPEGCVWHYCLPGRVNQFSPADEIYVQGSEECQTPATMPEPLPVIIQKWGRDLPSFSVNS